MDIQIIQLIFSVLILIMSVVIHEVSHGYAALALGDPTAKYQNRLTLNPVKHLDPIGSFIVPIIGFLSGGFIIGWAKPVPYNPYNLKNQRWGELWVAIAGPLSNLLVALVFGLIIRFGATSLPVTFLSICFLVVYINIFLALFNLVPIPPLDGSKVLFAFLPYRFQHIKTFFERYAFIIILIIILIPQISYSIAYLVAKAAVLLTGVSL